MAIRYRVLGNMPSNVDTPNALAFYHPHLDAPAIVVVFE